MKEVKTDLSKKLIIVLPLIEEVSSEDCIPVCLIGAKIKSKETILFHFATIDDKPETEELLFKACELIVDKFKDKYPKTNVTKD
jgi:hypothetical protein